MNVLSLNCQGIGNPWTVKALKGLVSLNIPNLVFLSETRCTEDEMVEVRQQLGWKFCFSVDCRFVPRRKTKGVSRAGGLCLLWDEDVAVEVQSSSDSHIDVVVGESSDPKRWRFTGFYGQPKVENRHLSWTLLRTLRLHGNLPWVIGGDLNEIMSTADKEGGVVRHIRQILGLVEALDFCLWHANDGKIGLGLLEWFISTRARQTIFPYYLKSGRKALEEWSFNQFGSLKRNIEDIRAQLAVFYDTTQIIPIEELKVELEAKLNNLLHQELLFWRQRAKVFWLQDGDANTKFFHQRASNRKKKNYLHGLFDDYGAWHTDDENLERIVLEYFHGLFTSSRPFDFHAVLDIISPVISEDANALLVGQISEDEVFRALKQMHPSKAPGPDGFSPCFYKHFWGLVGKDVVEAIRCFLFSEELLKSVNSTYVTLIPKVKKVQYVNQLRPISLCNVLYKLGSKVLANRIKPLMDSVVSPFQSAFVPGLLISDNSLIAYEIAHFLKKRRRGKKGFCALKLDMSKAYDKVEWNFLEGVMLKMGFCSIWVKWIMGCVKSVSYLFLVNGVPREVLSRLISFEEDQGRLNGVKICTAAPSISHLFFADDSFIFCKAESDQVQAVKDVLRRYEAVSGQEVNLQKSAISFSRNVPLHEQFLLAECLGVQRVDKHDKYLGLPLELSYSKEEAFGYLIERVQKRTSRWREKLLSAAGKEILIKAVAQAIPSYVMNCFELPKQLCHEMHRLMAQFWWGDSENSSKLHWLSWERMCDSKKLGGLGFHTGFMKATVEAGDSFTWRSIISGRNVLEQGLRYQVGNGMQISVWEDRWMPMPYCFKPYTKPPEGLDGLVVADLIDQGEHVWFLPLLQEMFTLDEVCMIASIPLSIRPAEDRLIWHYDRRGTYNVKSGYFVWRETARRGATSSSSSNLVGGQLGIYWSLIWKAKIPAKVKMFVWRLMRGILPTRTALADRRVAIHDCRCVFCGLHFETRLHLSKNCEAIRLFWHNGPLHLSAMDHPATNFSEWVWTMMDELDSEKRCLFFMSLWTLWSERNKVVWQEAVFDPIFATKWMVKYLVDFQRCHCKPSVKKKRLPTKWECPPRGRLKINVDGAFRVVDGNGGIGVVARNDEGVGVAAIARPIVHAHSAFNMEVDASRAGLLLGIYQAYMSAFQSVQVRHIYREANGVADRLAHLASVGLLDAVWLEETPAIIQDATLVQSIRQPENEQEEYFSTKQEAYRNDVERAFGILQTRFAIVKQPARGWDKDSLSIIMLACIILHNMIVEDEQDDYYNNEFDDDKPNPDRSRRA
ncbi:uncharacterized protein LOC112199393 [Rosa chinensis]|uniref:uncharacterized protein LOC112199393 n=1 Tax=Rosa chinensis TaxID=74649 RepID=UPI000D095BAB|nr:uncharacterized protein LOC112199393 [Rosa chinensis]